jgi:cytochrome P450 PksS
MNDSASLLADFTDVEAVTALYPMLAKLQETDPVHWSPQLNAWVVTRYADISSALRDPALSSQRMDLIVRYQLRNHDPAVAKDFERVGLQHMLFRDGAEHHRLRVLGNRGFTPSMLDRARPMVQRVVDSLLDQVQSKGRMDLVEDFAQPLPALAIAELFGIPAEDRQKFQEWSNAAATFFGGNLFDPRTQAKAANDGIIELERYFLNLVDERKKHPGHDLLSLLLAGQAEGKLSAEEVCAQCILILIAGHVTTIDQMSNGVHAFMQNPEQWQLLRGDPKRVTAAVEEVLRFDTAVPFIHRIAKAETKIGERTISPGQVVYLGLAAANHDPAVFANPDRFDISRTNNNHLSFAMGPHVCLGANLARRELEIGLTTLARQMPTLHLAAQPPRRRCENIVFRGFYSLPVEF